MPRRPRPVEERFWEKVDKNGPILNPDLGECWIWTAYRTPLGYGHLGRGPYGAGQYRAHRLAYELVIGPIPDGMLVLHDCDNPSCVRPAHLTLGSHTENMRQMSARGRASKHGTLRHGERASNVKLTETEVLEIIRLHGEGARQVDLAAQFGVSQPQVSHIVRRVQWRSLTVSD